MTKLSDKTIFVFVLLASLLIYIPYIQSFDSYQECRHYQSGDSFWYESIVISVIQDGDLNIANNVGKEIHLTGALAMSKDGQLVPKHSILFSLATIPFYLIFGAIGAMYFNLFLVVLLNGILYYINRVFFDKNISLITTFLFATGTIIMNYSYNYMGSVFSTVLMAAGLLFVLRKKYFLGAIFLAYACFSKASNVPWVAIIFAFVFYDFIKPHFKTKDSSELFRSLLNYAGIILIFVINLVPLFLTNFKLFGNILRTGYHQTASLDENFNLITLDYTDGFNQEILTGLNNLLFHPTVGIIEANPIIIIGALGAVLLYKMPHRIWAIMLITLIVAQFLLFSKWDMWYATEFGNRFLMFAIVLFAPFTANIINILVKKFNTQQEVQDL